jgi:LmbE family N-acetylglucosaminyl deacetylase
MMRRGHSPSWPGSGPRRPFLALTCIFTLLGGLSLVEAAPEPAPAAAILQELRSFRELGSVLYIAAHPDDENTQLLAYLARGRNYRTGYLSLTRGDGGQNVLGPEFGDELGVIRTQELLAARRLDGGRQFFSRAIDFGFSKDYRETLGFWDRPQVLSDIVRVIRTFRPDVLIARFSPQPGGTHGHHTASAVLALEAFKLAGDPKAFPEQLGGLTPWQPRRVLLNIGWWGRDAKAPVEPDLLKIDVNGNDPLTGESFAAIAGRSRSMHKTQGFDKFTGPGGPARPELFRTLDGEPATKDILDGVDTTWNRVPGGAETGRLSDEAISQFNPQDPAASVPALLALRSRLAALPADPVVEEKRRQLDHIVQACLGLSVKTQVTQAEVVPGETLKLRSMAMVSSSVVPVRWVGVQYSGKTRPRGKAVDLQSGKAATREATQKLSVDTPLSQPYWLREPHTIGMFRVNDPALIGRPENPPVFPIEQVFEIGGQTLVIPDEPVQIASDQTGGETRRRLEVIAPVSLKFASEVRLFAPGAARLVEVEVAAFRPGIAGSLRLEAPTGWTVSPATQPFRLSAVGEKAQLTFTVTAPPQPSSASITASAEISGCRYGSERVEIHYPHISPVLLQPPVRLKAVSFDLATRGHKVGYVPGAGDGVLEGLKQMGYVVTTLTGADLTAERLRDFDAVVIGIRAFNVRTDLAPQLPALFAYVEAGGNVIMQYNNQNGLQNLKLAPFDLRLSSDRVTDENAAVTFLAPDHPVLNTPNKITSADFAGWVQERGIYFPNQWDGHFTPILACSDPGEAPLKGGLLVANYGKGYFVYTGLVFFRELPAGVPGAYRLFANLVSLGK